ncbi:MAG: hypothetical protein NPIRA01_28740 [Nitrospirales bacterium]|nr:MAG: hypothetical protein NPIRA01_28740 [Nitrospirales bacterium]
MPLAQELRIRSFRGLTMIARSKAAVKAARLKGRLNLEIDLETSRERNRR